MKDRQDPGRIGVVIYDSVEPIDIGGTLGVVSMAQRVLPQIEAVVIGERAGPIHLAGGLSVLAGYGFADAPACDVVVVCGGAGWREQITHAPMLKFLRGLAPAPVASVCTGALILAAAGLLDGLPATTRRNAVGAETTSPLAVMATLGCDLQPLASVVVDAGIVTGGGVSLAIDTTLYLIGRLYGDDARDEVARVIEYDRAWQANRQALGHLRHPPRLEQFPC